MGCASPFKGTLQLEAHVLYLFQQLYVKIRKMICSGSSERPPPAQAFPIESELPGGRDQTLNQTAL